MAQPELDHSGEKSIREHVVYLLRGGGAHLSFDDFIGDFPVELCNRRIDKLPYTPWQILEHMRLAQWDILEFSRDANHVSPAFPTGYWPAADQFGSREAWENTVTLFRDDLRQMAAIVADDATNLFAPIPHGDGQTILREALVTADHNAYHLGALSVMNRLLGS